MATARVTWLGQAPAPAPDKWTRSEKILLLGVFINALFLFYEIRRGNRNAFIPVVRPGG
jgi:hypothetical protein